MSLDINSTLRNEKFQKVLEIFKDKNKVFIVVDGIIGAGKTTVILLVEKYINNNINNKSKKKLKAKAILEPVDKWNSTGALQYFYDNIAKNCYEFQTFTYITRINSVIDEIYANQDADVYILERSIWTDRYIFMELLKDLVGPMRMAMYNEWCDTWSYIMPMRVDKWVLLNTSLDESLKRISLRNRDGETNGISIEYQTNLYTKHTEFYDKLKTDGKPVIIIDSNIMDKDFINDESKIKDIIEQILN